MCTCVSTSIDVHASSMRAATKGRFIRPCSSVTGLTRNEVDAETRAEGKSGWKRGRLKGSETRAAAARERGQGGSVVLEAERDQGRHLFERTFLDGKQ